MNNHKKKGKYFTAPLLSNSSQWKWFSTVKFPNDKWSLQRLWIQNDDIPNHKFWFSKKKTSTVLIYLSRSEIFLMVFVLVILFGFVSFRFIWFWFLNIYTQALLIYFLFVCVSVCMSFEWFCKRICVHKLHFRMWKWFRFRLSFLTLTTAKRDEKKIDVGAV